MNQEDTEEAFQFTTFEPAKKKVDRKVIRSDDHHWAEKDSLGETHDQEVEKALNDNASDEEMSALNAKHEQEIAELQNKHSAEVKQISVERE